MAKQVISFYYPGKNIGGAQLLFARTAEYLQKAGFYIKIYENTECYISKYLQRKNIDFESVNKENNRLSVGDSEIFLLSLSYISLIFNEFTFSNNTRFVFWDLHPYCLLEQTTFSGFYKRISNDKIRSTLVKLFDSKIRTKINSLIDSGTKKHGVLFMCDYNFFFNKKTFGFKNEIKLLPIPIEIIKTDYLLGQKQSKKLRIGWISRLERDKNNILTLLLADLANSNLHDLELVIIGNGSDEKFIKEYVIKSKMNNVRFAGKIDTEDLSQFLIENIDIGFSMGTSALEFALRKIPTVLVPSPTEFKHYSNEDKKYEWLKDIGGYDVCTYKVDNRLYKTFSSILNYYAKNKEPLKRETYGYVSDKHNIDVVINDLIEVLKKCDLSFADLIEIGFNKATMFERILFLFKREYKKLRNVTNKPFA